MANLHKGIGTPQRMQYRRFEVKEHTNKFNRVVSQAQQVLANVQANLNTQGVKAAKETYKIQMQAMHEWCQNEVDKSN